MKENKVGINAGQVGINAAGHGEYGIAGGLLRNHMSHINNIGVVAGEKAAHVIIHDSMKENKVGIRAGHIGQHMGQVGINAAGHGEYGIAGGLLRNNLSHINNIGVVAGEKAAHVSIHDSMK